ALLAPGPGSHSYSPVWVLLFGRQLARVKAPVPAATFTQRPSSGSPALALAAVTRPHAHVTARPHPMTFVRLIRILPLPSLVLPIAIRTGHRRLEAATSWDCTTHHKFRRIPRRLALRARSLPAVMLCGGFLGPVLLTRGAFASLALLALLVVLAALLERFGELLLPGKLVFFDLRAARDPDFRRLLDQDAVLPGDFGRH